MAGVSRLRAAHGRIDDGLSIAARPDVIFAAFGDMMRVPGTHAVPGAQGSRHGRADRLFAVGRDQARQDDPEKHVISSRSDLRPPLPRRAHAAARQAGRIQTSPCFAITLRSFRRFARFSIHRHAPRRLHRPGHVSTVIGCRPYEWIAQNEKKPIVVSDLSRSICSSPSSWFFVSFVQAKRVWRINTARGALGRQFRALRAMAEVFHCGLILSGAAWIHLPIRPSASRGICSLGPERTFEVPGIRVTDPRPRSAVRC